MNRKNILIFIGVSLLAFILYKLLLGLFLPIALFVSLGYVMKFLLKDSESDPVQKVSLNFNSSQTSDSTENIFDIKPVEETKSVEEYKPVENDKSV